MIGDRRAPANVDGRIRRLIELGRDREAAELGAAEGGRRSPRWSGGAMDPMQQFDQLGPVLGQVVGNISSEQLDNPTPCARFTVRGVLGHMVEGATAFAAAFRGERAAAPSPPPADVLGAFGPALAGLAEAVQQPGALQRTIATPFGEFDGETFARFVVLDGLVHAWDLAQATGQQLAVDDELVLEVTQFAGPALEGLRDGDRFAAEVAPPPGATPVERLAALTGREVPVAA